MRGLRRTEKFKTDNPGNRNLKRKPRGPGRHPKGKAGAWKVAPVRRNTLEKGSAGRPSTKAEREAWKQAERNADKRKWTKGNGSGTGKNHCEGKPGRRERKKQRLSSQSLKRKQTKGSRSKGRMPKEAEETKRKQRQAPMERLRERSREGRKETRQRTK